MSTAIRENLGDYSSIISFKSLVTGIEDALGEKATAIALIAAGRTHGKKIALDLDVVDTTLAISAIAAQLDAAVGQNGMRLTAVHKIEQESDVIKVYCTETVCSAGEALGSSRKCTFTLGVIGGALEVLTGYQRLQGTHTESVLRGGAYDVFEFKAVH
jgi:hypothetical protein